MAAFSVRRFCAPEVITEPELTPVTVGVCDFARAGSGVRILNKIGPVYRAAVGFSVFT